MISNPERTLLVSSMGWVDRDGLWRFDVSAASPERVALDSGASYVSLHWSGSAQFAAGHHFDGRRFEVTVHGFSDLARVHARAVVTRDERILVGDASAWAAVPRLYLAHLSFPPWKDFVLVRISAPTGGIEVQRLEWYDQTYDKDYQGVIDALELPEDDMALIAVQRSSQLIVHDLKTGRKKGSCDLGGRGGNPTLKLREGGREIWASDYDTLAMIRTKDRRILRRRRLQGAAVGTQQFIGGYSFAPDEDACVVARPFSGDVVEVDAVTLRTRRSVPLGRQPLDVAALPRGEVVARDWKTGDMLRGTLKRRRWFWFGA